MDRSAFALELAETHQRVEGIYASLRELAPHIEAMRSGTQRRRSGALGLARAVLSFWH